MRQGELMKVEVVVMVMEEAMVVVVGVVVKVEVEAEVEEVKSYEKEGLHCWCYLWNYLSCSQTSS